MKRIRRILYATDFSTASRKAFDTAVHCGDLAEGTTDRCIRTGARRYRS